MKQNACADIVRGILEAAPGNSYGGSRYHLPSNLFQLSELLHLAGQGLPVYEGGPFLEDLQPGDIIHARSRYSMGTRITFIIDGERLEGVKAEYAGQRRPLLPLGGPLYLEGSVDLECDWGGLWRALFPRPRKPHYSRGRTKPSRFRKYRGRK